MKLVNIEICSNNRDNYLFRFFIPSLKYIQKMKKFCCITINYNGDISQEKIEEANKAIRDLGFELYWGYKTYNFEKGKNKILKIRNDCDKIGPKTKYILLGDDDLEFLQGYDRYLLASIIHLEQHPDVGIVSLRHQVPHMRTKDILHPAGTDYFFVLCGGLLVRRLPQWNGLYPQELLELHGGGEERILGCEMMREGYKGYYLHTDKYIHERHWGVNGVFSGQGVYAWSWDQQDPETVMSRIASYKNKDKNYSNYDLAWTGDKYWLYLDNKICFANKTTDEMYYELGDLIGIL